MESGRRAIEDRATELLRKRESDAWGAADEAELIRWKEASTANRVAFLRAEAAWEEMGRLKALGAGLPRRTVPTPEALDSIHLGSASETAAALPVRRPNRAVIGIAASILAVAGLALASYGLWFTGDRYATPVGGVASLPLADGSRITLNTDSKVRVIFSGRQRQVDLSQGEAFFEVAPDGNRPFVVQAGDRRVVAVGTKFSVRREGDVLQVVVTEGHVRVDNGETQRSDGAQAAAPDQRAAPIMLSPGAVVRARNEDVVVENHPLAEAEEILSWRSGYVMFRETRLDAAVAEFNRYNARQILIRDASVAAMQLTGKFRATNSDAFVNLLQQTYGIEVERTEASIVLAAPP
jgi:transmembrane sensor